MQLKRVPAAALRPFVRRLWVLDSRNEPVGGREQVLPTGTMHLVVRLNGAPFTLYGDASGVRPETIGHAVVGGARSSPYVRGLSPGRSVGVQLEPAAAGLLFGAAAHELAERHTPLDDLWGDEASALRERLAAIEAPEKLLTAVESVISDRLPRVRGIDPAIARAVDLFSRSMPVGDVVAEIGWSHRRFIDRFRESVGMSPKRFCRVRRLARVLGLSQRMPGAPLAELALAAGYSDQPHFNREFRELAGMTPGEYRAAAPVAPHHVPVNFFQD